MSAVYKGTLVIRSDPDASAGELVLVTHPSETARLKALLLEGLIFIAKPQVVDGQIVEEKLIGKGRQE